MAGGNRFRAVVSKWEMAFLAIALTASVTRAASASMPPLVPFQPPSAVPARDYRIGPLDGLNITVFQVKD